MSPDKQTPQKRKFSPFGSGFGHLPPAFDLALQWALKLAIAVLIGFFAGRWIDGKLGTTPLFLLIGVFWGIGGSFYILYIQVKKMQAEEDSKDNSPTGGM